MSDDGHVSPTTVIHLSDIEGESTNTDGWDIVNHNFLQTIYQSVVDMIEENNKKRKILQYMDFTVICSTTVFGLVGSFVSLLGVNELYSSDEKNTFMIVSAVMGILATSINTIGDKLGYSNNLQTSRNKSALLFSLRQDIRSIIHSKTDDRGEAAVVITRIQKQLSLIDALYF